MGQRQLFSVENGFQVQPVGTGLCGHCEGRFINFDNFVHLFQINQNSTIKRNNTSLASGAAPIGDNRDAVTRSNLQNAGHFIRRLREHNPIRGGRMEPSVHPDLRHQINIHTISEFFRFMDSYVFISNNVQEFILDHVKEKVRFHIFTLSSWVGDTLFGKDFFRRFNDLPRSVSLHYISSTIIINHIFAWLPFFCTVSSLKCAAIVAFSISPPKIIQVQHIQSHINPLSMGFLLGLKLLQLFSFLIGT